MRPTTLFVALLFLPAPLFAQSTPCAPSSQPLVQFDPYRPSHLAIVRNYGATVMSQASLDSLLKLDPYVPTEAALLRQVGGAMPFWAASAYPWYAPAQAASPCATVEAQARVAAREVTDLDAGLSKTAPAMTTFSDVLARVERRTPASTGATRSIPSAERNLGVTLRYDGRIWTSAGRAVPMDEREFVRVADGPDGPIFQRARRERDLIYVPTTPGLVAPFRARTR